MDELFIRMCQEARELQEQWEAKPGDRAKYPGYQVQFLDRGHMDYYNFESLIWLPRQEDLQQIVLNKFKDLHWSTNHLLWHFNSWFKDFLDLTSKYCLNYDLTQLWLCYVMEEFYKKYWSGTTWEKIQ